jgi:hypothetical protein
LAKSVAGIFVRPRGMEPDMSTLTKLPAVVDPGVTMPRIEV